MPNVDDERTLLKRRPQSIQHSFCRLSRRWTKGSASLCPRAQDMAKRPEDAFRWTSTTTHSSRTATITTRKSSFRRLPESDAIATANLVGRR